MQAGYIAAGMWVLAGCAIYGIVRSLRTGVEISTFTYRLDQNPAGFMMVLLSQVFIVGMAIAETLHAVGLVGDPFVGLAKFLPFHR